MPVRSVAQRDFLAINKPGVLQKLAADGSRPTNKNLPYKGGGGGMLSKIYGKKGTK